MDLRRFEHAGLTFDQERGLGNVPFVEEVEIRGCVGFVDPETFLTLCPPRERRSAAIADAIGRGCPISMGFLLIDLSQDVPVVVGHEGRGRMAALAEHLPGTAMPVALLFGGGVRARHLGEDVLERLNAGLVRQDREDGTTSTQVEGPLFERFLLSGREILPAVRGPAP